MSARAIFALLRREECISSADPPRVISGRVIIGAEVARVDVRRVKCERARLKAGGEIA